MGLVWVKSGGDILVGELEDRLSVEELVAKQIMMTLRNPMTLHYVTMPQPSALHQKQPMMVTGFRFVTIPCGAIVLSRVDYCGEIKNHDPVYVTYYKVLESVKEQAGSPLMVTQ